MDQKYSIILLGNGFDISLNQNTKYQDYINWVKIRHKNITYYTQTKEVRIINQAINFIDEFEKWKQPQKNEYLWSDLENDLLIFFKEKNYNFKNKIKLGKGKKLKVNKNYWNNLVKSYSMFCFLMQEYYLPIIKYENKKNQLINKKIIKFDNIVGHNKVVAILSLNYTFPYDFVNDNIILKNKEIISSKYYFLHYTIFSNYIFNFKNITELNSSYFKGFKKFGDVNNIIDLLSCKFINSEMRDKISIPIIKISYKAEKLINFEGLLENFKEEIKSKIKSENTIEKALKIISNINVYDFIIKNKSYWINARGMVIPQQNFFQSLILGNENVNEKNDLSFLSKSKGDYLCFNNYPKTILNSIDIKIKNLDIIKGEINIFGYSFGAADATVNDWLKTKMENGWRINLCFWEEDKNCDFVKTTKSQFEERFRNKSCTIKFW